MIGIDGPETHASPVGNRWDRLVTEALRLMRFGIVGFAAMGVYWLVTNLIAAAGVPLLPASVVGYVAAGLVSYFGHSCFSFKVSVDHGTYGVRFLIVALLGLVINLVLIPAGSAAKLPAVLTTAVISITIPAINYLFNRLWVFASGLDNPRYGSRSPGMDTSVPRYKRFSWPKAVPALDEEQRRISDDFMKHWHEVLPAKYGAIETFNHQYATRRLPDLPRFRTLELGAGLGGHLAFEDLDRQDYHCIELRRTMADAISRRYPSVKTAVGDCQDRIPFPDDHFDRVVVIHVLEHLPRLPEALDEVKRVLRPGGLFSVVLPCDPGLAYAVARKISAERIFRRRYRTSYGWLIRREHINSPAEILSLLGERFAVEDRAYFPLKVPLVHLNLCIGVTLRKP